MGLTFRRINYKDLKEEIHFNDSHCLISDYLTPAVTSTLLTNPSLKEKEKTALNIVISDGVVVGRNMLMPTRLKVRQQVFTVQTGGSYEVVSQMRGKGIGTASFRDSIYNSDYDTYIGQLYSTAAIAIIRKLGLIVFDLPSYYKLCKSRCILEAKGLKGGLLDVASFFVDAILRLLNISSVRRLNKLRSVYQVKNEKIIPSWVNELTLNDGHAFTEVHDKSWLQWCLDNKFTNDPNDKQSFFAVYDMQGNPKGFFMTKIRYEKQQGKYKNITRGTIVEWGSFNEDKLSEIDLNILAIDSFGSEVDNITTVLSSAHSEKEMKKIGFIRHGVYQMTIKPGMINQEGFSDIKNWRIRYGGCNTIVF